MYTLADLSAFGLAVLLIIPLCILPGYTIAWIGNVMSARQMSAGRLAVTALLCGLCVLPALSNLVGQALGLHGAMIFCLILALPGVWVMWQGGRFGVSWGKVLAMVLWAALLLVCNSDFNLDFAGLPPSVVIIDMVKHAAVIRELALSNQVPFPDPFFLRDNAASYYYFYYLPGGMIQQILGDIGNARMAFSGTTFWAGLSVVAFTVMLYEGTGLAVQKLEKLWLLIVILFSIGSFQLALHAVLIISGIISATSGYSFGGVVEPMWFSVVWVPHHVLAVAASLFAIMILVHHARHGKLDPIAMLIAGIIFASVAGLSLWIALVSAAIMAVWLIALLREKNWSLLISSLGAGVTGLVVASPYLYDTIVNRVSDTFPLSLKIFDTNLGLYWTVMGMPHQKAQLLALLVDDIVQFGVLAVAAVIFWLTPDLRRRFHGEMARVSLIAGVVSLIIASFVASTIQSNDLGMRAGLFLQFIASLWCVALMQYLWQHREAASRLPHYGLCLIIFCTMLGGADSAFNLRGLRENYKFTAQFPQTEFKTYADLRRAYSWLNINIPPNAITQHNPDTLYAFSYGLYGHNQVAVSDIHNGLLFGAGRKNAKQRREELAPVFDQSLNPTVVSKILHKNKIDYAIVSQTDPVWQDKTSWVWKVKPVFALDRVSVFQTSNIAQP